MTTFQFDENNSCTSFIKRCKKGGLANAKRFQRGHKNTKLKDPEMLKIYLALGGVLITFDNHMIDDHENDIPKTSPGIVIIEHSPRMLHPITQKSAEKIIGRFKDKLPDWHKVPFENSIVRISDASIIVGRKLDVGVVYDCHATLDDDNCDQKVRERLVKNASGNNNG